MSLSAEQLELGLIKAGVQYSTADLMALVDADVGLDETPIAALRRRAAERAAQERRAAADSVESKATAARRSAIRQKHPNIFA